MLRFRAGGSSYAIPVRDVREVRPGGNLSSLPLSREGVAGITKKDGMALPVLSVLGSERDRLLVLEAGGRSFGLLVHDVTGIADVDEEQLGPPPEGQDAAMVTGVLDAGADMVLVLDAAALVCRVLD
jgi:chemotaxis signal transduction protein